MNTLYEVLLSVGDWQRCLIVVSF